MRAVLEGTLEIQTAGQTPGRCGIYIEETTGQGSAVIVGTDGQSQLGALKLEGAKSFEPDDFVEAGITPRRKHTFRLLTRYYMLEFYLDDRLIQCYSIPERATGRTGLVVQGGRLVVEGLNAWSMTFAADGVMERLPAGRLEGGGTASRPEGQPPLKVDYPHKHSISQRTGSTGEILIEGSLGGPAGPIEVRFNSGPWTVIHQGVKPGKFAAAVTGDSPRRP